MRKSILGAISVFALTGVLLTGCASMSADMSVNATGSGSMTAEVTIKKDKLLSVAMKYMADDGLGSLMTEDMLNAYLLESGFSVTTIDGVEYYKASLFSLVSENGADKFSYSSISDFYNQFGDDLEMLGVTTDSLHLSETSVEIDILSPEADTETDDSFTELLPGLSEYGITEADLNDVTVSYTVHFDTEIASASKNAVLSEDKKAVTFTISASSEPTDFYAYCVNDIDVNNIKNGKIYGKNTTVKLPEGVSATVNGTASAAGSTVSFAKSGSYDVKMKTADGTQETLYFSVDATAPKITGIKNNQFIKNTKTAILLSDDMSGINTVTLDGKNIYGSLQPIGSSSTLAGLDYFSTWQLPLSSVKDGKHTLVAADYLGNKKTVRFTLDTKAPTVKGVKNGKKYTKAVTIKFSDKYGVKKATLNGKKIKSGKKVAKKGNYTLKVTDKAGNTKKIKFTIKKKAGKNKKK